MCRSISTGPPGNCGASSNSRSTSRAARARSPARPNSPAFFGAIYGDLFFGQTPAAGQLTVSENEAATVPATTPYTVAVANASGYVDDLGVYYATGNTAGGRFTRVTTPSAAGQYSVNPATGIYTFAAADANEIGRASCRERV